MSNFTVDLTNCDREPIHIPGQIQNHGFLIVLDQENKICFFSDNTHDFINGIAADLLGKPLKYLEDILGMPGHIQRVMAAGIESQSFLRLNPVLVTLDHKSYNLIISPSAYYHLLEFESATSNFDLDVQSTVGRSIADILSHRQMKILLDQTAIQVKDIIHYDRVMIYRFAEDGHGEVVAEAKNEDLTPWIGLHYPASDIPQQARELYKLNLTRIIADVYAPTSKITTSATQVEPLDLTWSQLRAVSPIHIQYLKNMGVASSFSISLVYKDKLWGLIACHNYTPRFIDYRSREYAKLIGQILSSALEFREDEESLKERTFLNSNVDIIAKALQGSENIAQALMGKPAELLNVVQATGVVLLYDKNVMKIGQTPDDAQLADLIAWIKNNINENNFHTVNLPAIYPPAATFAALASGLLTITLYSELSEFILWFKPEIIQNINWAGDPAKPVEINADKLLQISPRHSFEVWAQTVTGVSASWSQTEVNAAARLREEIIYAVNLKAGAIRVLNERLRLAYEELETFSYTISHDLKGPLASIKSYAQLLIRDQHMAEKGQLMLRRIAERAEQMNLMINAVLDYSRIGRLGMQYRPIKTGSLIADIINDLELVYDTNNIRITVGETPDLIGDPMMMLQVFSNLIGNAVKYSQHENPAIIHIEGMTSDIDICYTIKDNGLGIATSDLPKIFELFNRMDNVKDIEGTGVGLAIVKRIVEKHKGRIWAESELNQGSKFYVAFNRKVG